MPDTTLPSPPASPTDAAAAPDWSTLPHDVTCPLCDYNLRGLVDPRCPECGYSFTWPDVLDARRRPHPYLFEHHPERNTWSFLRTFLAAFRPRRFWSTLSPFHVVRTRRLRVYWLVVLVLFLGGAAACLVIPIADAIANVQAARVKTLQQIQTIQAYAPAAQLHIDRWYPPVWTPRGIGLVFSQLNPILPTVTLFVLAWPLLTFASLMLFQQSMRRARIRPAQIFRCVVYSFDPAPIILLLLAAWAAYGDGPIRTYRRTDPLWEEVAISLLAGYRLAHAYRHYLKFSHAWPTVLASQIIVLLLGWIAWFRWL